MSATPATPRMIGSAHEERRFTVPESSRQSDASLSRALALARRGAGGRAGRAAHRFRRHALADRPRPVHGGLVDGAEGALAALAERLAVVAIVTGRIAARCAAPRRRAGAAGRRQPRHRVARPRSQTSRRRRRARRHPQRRGRTALGRRPGDARRRDPDHKGVSASSTTARRPTRRRRGRRSWPRWATSSRSACGSATGA